MVSSKPGWMNATPPNVEYWQSLLPGLQTLWEQTRGSEKITIAMLDGAADLKHPCFDGADLRVVESLVPADSSSCHGTGVASVLFGRPGSDCPGLAPGCRGLLIPIFDADPGKSTACSQIDLARAVRLALQHGANVINISGGQLDNSGQATPLLAKAISDSAECGVLVVAAAGNDGCECLHVPAAEPSVLVVGATDNQGRPLEISNWGRSYRQQGIVAPGKGVPAAIPGGGVEPRIGTSWSTPIVSGIAALLLSLQIQRGLTPDSQAVREALLATAQGGCDLEPSPECGRFLKGRLNVAAAMGYLDRSSSTTIASDSKLREVGRASQSRADSSEVSAWPFSPTSLAVRAASAEEVPALSYAVGRIGFDFGNESRRNWFHGNGFGGADDAEALLAYLTQNPTHASALTFTLMQGSVPIYALVPTGAFAAETYGRLRKILYSQATAPADQVSVPGVTRGSTRLMNGQLLPKLYPDLRGMRSWSTRSLTHAALGPPPPKDSDEHAQYLAKQAEVSNFLGRLHSEIRNLGLNSSDRALSFATTHALELDDFYVSILEQGMRLAGLDVEKNRLAPPGADLWDVELRFFHPEQRLQRAFLVYRLTVDVRDVVPRVIGSPRHWYLF